MRRKCYQLIDFYEMIEIEAPKFLKAIERISTMLGVLSARPGMDISSPTFRTQIQVGFEELFGQLQDMELPLSANKARSITESINSGSKLSDLEHAFFELRSRIREEMNLATICFVNAEDRQYYTRTKKLALFEGSLIARYPACIVDIEEGAKSFALERFAGCVFHLMRVVEVAVIELQELFDKPDAKAHFGSVVSRLEALFQKTKFDDLPQKVKDNHAFLLGVLPHLHSVKDAWRNKFIHADGRIIPSESYYTREMALEIMNATSGLMRKMAERTA
jgi:hypothetical protein